MVSYVLLIVIAVGLSAFVFSYLKVYVPKEKPECPDDIHLIVQEYSCSQNSLTLTLANKGLFTIGAAYIRVGIPGRKVRQLVNDPDTLFKRDVNLQEKPNEFYIDLEPGKSTEPYDYVAAQIESEGEYILEVQPAVFTEKGELALCKNAVITQTITCTLTP